jgi:hypothetical protein
MAMTVWARGGGSDESHLDGRGQKKNFNDSLVWPNTIGICGKNVVRCWPLSPI